MDNLFAFLILISFIMLIIGFFSPRISLFWHKKQRTKKKSAIIYGVMLIIFLILLGTTSNNDPKYSTKTRSNKSDNQQSEKNIQEENENNLADGEINQENEVSYIKIGEEITIKNFVYKVNKIEFKKSVGSDFMKETADGIYLIIDLSLKNLDNQEHTLDNSLFKLTDTDGTEYESSPDGSMALEMDGKETLFLKQCNPKIQKQGFLVFEVPEKGIYDLHLSGGYWSGRTAIVKLTDI